MKNKKGNVAVIAIIIVIVTTTTGVITWLVATKSQAPVQQSVVQPAPVAKTEPVAPTVAQPAPVDKNLDLVYKNEKYGFEFAFDSGYKNLWGISTGNNTIDDAIDSFYFTIKNAPNSDFIFAINVYDKSWWLKNATVDNDKSAWKKDGDHSLPNNFGIYLGSSDKFAYTLWPNSQSCPDLGDSGPGPLCKLTAGKTQMVTNSFKITNK